jgi:hypothetical protein
MLLYIRILDLRKSKLHVSYCGSSSQRCDLKHLVLSVIAKWIEQYCVSICKCLVGQ